MGGILNLAYKLLVNDRAKFVTLLGDFDLHDLRVELYANPVRDGAAGRIVRFLSPSKKVQRHPCWYANDRMTWCRSLP